MVNQVSGDYITNEEHMWQYLAQTKTLKQAFKTFELTLVPREQNEKADHLVKLASDLELDVKKGTPKGM